MQLARPNDALHKAQQQIARELQERVHNDHFLHSLRRDLRVVYRCRNLILKPLLLAAVMVAFTQLVRTYAPWLLMNLFDRDADVFGLSVFVIQGMPYAVIAGKAIGVVWLQNDQVNEAMRTNNLALFESYCYRRIPGPMKVALFYLSLTISYSVASVQYVNLWNALKSEELAYSTLIVIWMVAYEMDDPMNGVWNIAHRIKQEWWEKIKVNFYTDSKGRLHLKETIIRCSQPDAQNGEEMAKELAE